MNPLIPFDPLSVITLKIEMWFHETHLADGTAFLYKKEEKIYLITNWHCVSGKHPETGKCLSKTAAIPNRLKIFLKIYLKDQYLKPFTSLVPLYIDEDHTEPVWLVHPLYKEKVDVVAIDITNFCPPTVTCINHLQEDPIKVDVGKGLFIVGYPKGIEYGPSLPIWRKGSFASEPSFAVDNLPKMLIDAATKKGMSGSPVLMKEWGSIETETNGFVAGTGSSFYRFIGIYSGREKSTSEFEAQIGFVWHKKVIEEIITQQASTP